MNKLTGFTLLETALSGIVSFFGQKYVELGTAATTAINGVRDELNGKIAVKADKRNAVTVTILTNGWINDTSVAAYPYKYEISVPSITAQDFVTINIAPGSQKTAAACGLCPTNETVAGKIRIRAAKIPAASISAEYWIEKGKG